MEQKGQGNSFRKSYNDLSKNPKVRVDPNCTDIDRAQSNANADCLTSDFEILDLEWTVAADDHNTFFVQSNPRSYREDANTYRRRFPALGPEDDRFDWRCGERAIIFRASRDHLLLRSQTRETIRWRLSKR